MQLDKAYWEGRDLLGHQPNAQVVMEAGVNLASNKVKLPLVSKALNHNGLICSSIKEHTMSVAAETEGGGVAVVFIFFWEADTKSSSVVTSRASIVPGSFSKKRDGSRTLVVKNQRQEYYLRGCIFIVRRAQPDRCVSTFVNQVICFTFKA